MYVSPEFCKCYRQMDLFASNSVFGQKLSPNEVAIIKTRSATIAFLSSPSFLLLALSFSPFFSFVTVILKLLGLKKNLPFDAFSLNDCKFR